MPPVQTCGAGSSREVRSPIQTKIPAAEVQGLYKAKPKFFKEFAIIEACVCGFFLPGIESDLLKTVPFFSQYAQLWASQLVSAKKKESAKANRRFAA